MKGWFIKSVIDTALYNNLYLHLFNITHKKTSREKPYKRDFQNLKVPKETFKNTHFSIKFKSIL